MGYSDINISELDTILYNDSMNKFHNGIYSGKIGISIYFLICIGYIVVRSTSIMPMTY